MSQYKGTAKSFNAQGEHVGAGEWLQVVHAANGICEPSGYVPFGQPIRTYDRREGEYVEEYRYFEIIHLTEEGFVTITVRGDNTELAQVILDQAVAKVRNIK